MELLLDVAVPVELAAVQHQPELLHIVPQMEQVEVMVALLLEQGVQYLSPTMELLPAVVVAAVVQARLLMLLVDPVMLVKVAVVVAEVEMPLVLVEVRVLGLIALQIFTHIMLPLEMAQRPLLMR
jgi:hypothetical protein